MLSCEPVLLGVEKCLQKRRHVLASPLALTWRNRWLSCLLLFFWKNRALQEPDIARRNEKTGLGCAHREQIRAAIVLSERLKRHENRPINEEVPKAVKPSRMIIQPSKMIDRGHFRFSKILNMV